MMQSIISLYRSPYNKKHLVHAVYRFAYWKMIRLFKLKKIKYSLWGDRKLYLNYDSFQCMWIMYNYIVDWEEFNLIRDYVKHDDNVADVGTNMGYYSIWMSKFISDKGMIHAFEPDPENFERLQKNVSLNRIKYIQLNKIALSDIDGQLSFTINLDGENHISNQEDKNTVTVTSKRFDSYCKTHSIYKYSYVKVDVEGFEYQFLKGSAELLKNKGIGILQLEINNQVRNSGTNISELITLINDFGYTLCKYDLLKRELIPIDYSNNRENYFAVNDLVNINMKLKTGKN